jgi:hypothetical protein
MSDVRVGQLWRARVPKMCAHVVEVDNMGRWGSIGVHVEFPGYACDCRTWNEKGETFGFPVSYLFANYELTSDASSPETGSSTPEGRCVHDLFDEWLDKTYRVIPYTHPPSAVVDGLRKAFVAGRATLQPSTGDKKCAR